MDKPSAAGRFRCVLRADEHEVRAVLRRIVVHFAEDVGVEALGRLELVLAEVLNNIVEHAYGERGSGPIRLDLALQSGCMACRVEDDGRPMPDQRLPEGRFKPVATQVSDLAEGGWGWALIRNLTQDLAYQRVGQMNRLIFHLPLAAEP